MRLQHLPSEFQKALPVLEKIQSAGFEAYFVGGSVRDAILGRPIHDVDIATSSYPEETKSIFKKTVDIGIEHGTVLVLEAGGEYEVTTFRTEDVYVDFRRPSHVSFVRSLAEDLKRRDFTVNAFALDTDGRIIDQFNGLSDLADKRLRAVGLARERFHEDALRIMRGFRFAASLDFSIEPETFAAMAETAPLLEKISVERSFIEFDKLLTAPFWKKGLEAMVASQAYRYLPGLSDQQVGLTSLLEKISDQPLGDSILAWALLMIVLEISDVKKFLRAWKTSNHFQQQVSQLVQAYRERLNQSYDHLLVYHYGKSVLLQVENLRNLLGHESDLDRVERLDKELVIHDKNEIIVNGKKLMDALEISAGPILGELLKAIEKAIVYGQLTNQEDEILLYARDLLERKNRNQ